MRSGLDWLDATKLAVAGIALLLGSGAAAPALALGDAECVKYAQDAVKQFEQRQVRVCGQDSEDRGEWWNPDEGYHYRWCRGITNAGLLADGLKNRDKIIDRCKPRLSDADCNQYAEAAAQQDRDRLYLGCTTNIGMREWWNSDPGYHLRWCRGQTDRAPLQKGLQDRQNVLYGCMQPAPPELQCDQTFGLRQPRNVRKYLQPARPPSDGGMAVCIYEFGDGEEIRADAKWKQAVRWNVTVPTSEGCDPTRARVSATEVGLWVASDKFHASASVAGNSAQTRAMARDAVGAVSSMLILAELNGALPCR